MLDHLLEEDTEYCEHCGRDTGSCECAICEHCEQLEKDCECDKCNDCGDYLFHCECDLVVDECNKEKEN